MIKRDFADMVIFFCQKVSEMDMSRKDKMALLGMITAIEMKHDELMPKWIPVTEALPEEEKDVLLLMAEGEMAVGQRRGVNYWDGYRRRAVIVAWMPLPEPWKGNDGLA